MGAETVLLVGLAFDFGRMPAVVIRDVDHTEKNAR